MFRHLPPTAAPLGFSEFRAGFDALTHEAALEEFRAALRQYLGVRYCYLAASGRTALYLLLTRLRATADSVQRREVLLPAYTCPALVTVIQAAGLSPRTVDVSPSTLRIDTSHLETVLGPQTLAVLHVHPFGIPQALDSVLRAAHDAGAVVIEDAAQALGAHLDGRPVGTLGDYGLFSLGPGKPLSTGGGGMLCTGDATRAEVVAPVWQQCVDVSTLRSGTALVRLALLALAFRPDGWWLATRMGLHRLGDHEVGRRFTVGGLTPAQAGVGAAALRRLDSANRRRRVMAERLIAALQKLDGVHVPPSAETGEPIYLRLPVIVDDADRRDFLYRRLWNAGIGVGKMYRRPLPELFPEVTADGYTGAAEVGRRLLTLPTHHYVTHTDVRRIAAIFSDIPNLSKPAGCSSS